MDALALPLTNRLLLVTGTAAVNDAILDLIARLALRESPATCLVRVLDGGNHFNAYTVARSIRRRTADLTETPLENALRRIHLSRAFTCYQMVTLLQETPLDGTPTCLLDLLSTFYDEAVRLEESRRLLQICLNAIERLSSQAPVIVNVWPAGPRHADRACLYESLQAAAGQVWEQKAIPAPAPPRPWW